MGMKSLEVHSHSYIGGPNTKSAYLPQKVTHSHVGGDKPHQHENMGPATYTIDKDQWARATGLKGGGRKKFTAKPSGPQMECVELEEWQKGFTIIVDEESCRRMTADGTTGGADAAAARMMQAFGMKPEVATWK